MFEEGSFSDDEDSPVAAPITNSASSSSASQFSSMQSIPHRPSRRFHRPGDSGFQPIATPIGAAVSSARNKEAEELFSSGDRWGSATCQCLSCAAMRVGAMLQGLATAPRSSASSSSRLNLPTSTPLAPPAPPVMVLLDLDNFGFPHFKRPEPKRPTAVTASGSSNASKKRAREEAEVASSSPPLLSSTQQQQPSGSLVDSLFVWCFFGSCFPRKWGTFPDEYVASAPEGSLWHQLRVKRRVYFLPCGGHSQAVDEVLFQTAAMWESPVVVVTGDKDLAAKCTAASAWCRAVDVNQHERKLPLVFEGLAKAVASFSAVGKNNEEGRRGYQSIKATK